MRAARPEAEAALALLAAGPHQALGSDSEAVFSRLEPRAVRVEAIGVLKGDDLQADLPLGEVEEGIAEVEAELMQLPTARPWRQRRPYCRSSSLKI